MKRTSKIKRIACIGLIFLMSINSFATSVSDNDGSAFITKAEFDALKSSFQSQIDTYNQSIDSKIDTAIAAYLSGLRIDKQIDIVCNIEKLNAAYNVQWDNSSDGYQTTEPGYEYVFDCFIFHEVYDRSNRKIVKKYCGYNRKSLTFVAPLSMPICNKTSSGKLTINNYETRQTKWNVIGTWDFPFATDLDTTAAYQFGTAGTYQVLRDVNPCKNITVVNPPQVWAAGMNWDDINVGIGSNCTMVINGFCTVNTSTVDNALILLNTNASAKTYYFNLDNDALAVLKSSYDNTVQSFDYATWQTPPDMHSGSGTAATVLSGTATIKGLPKATTTTCPWDQTQGVSYDMYDSRLVNITGKDKPIKNGICMFEVDQAGKLTFDVTPEATGSVRIYAFKQSVPGTNLIDETINFTSATKRSYTYDITSSYSPSGSDKIEFWVIYKPDSGRKKLTVNKVMLEIED